MPATWIIEEDVFVKDEVDALIAEIARQGHAVERFRSLSAVDRTRTTLVPRCCVEYALAWTEGSASRFCAMEPFDVRAYSQVLGEELLNRAHVLVPRGELIARKAELFETLGEGGRLFVRPPESDKRFDGDVFTEKYFESDVKQLTEQGIGPDEPVVVARPLEVLGEWRFVIVEAEAVAGSAYSAHRLGHRPEFGQPPEDVFDYADAMAGRFATDPAPAWIIDVARLPGDVLRVVEMGPFACADLYGCEVEMVVEAVSDVA